MNRSGLERLAELANERENQFALPAGSGLDRLRELAEEREAELQQPAPVQEQRQPQQPQQPVQQMQPEQPAQPRQPQQPEPEGPKTLLGSEFAYDASQVLLTPIIGTSAIKAGMLYGFVEPSVAKRAYSEALNNDVLVADEFGNMERKLRTAFRRWKKDNPESKLDEGLWVKAHIDKRAHLFSQLGDNEKTLTLVGRAISRRMGPFAKSARTLIREHRVLDDPYDELTTEEKNSLNRSRNYLNESAEPFSVDPFVQTLSHFKKSIRESKDKGRGELLIDNFVELNQGSWHLIKQIIAAVPDDEYERLIRDAGIDFGLVESIFPDIIEDRIKSGVGIGKSLGYGFRAMIKAIDDDPAGMIRARPLDTAMIGFLGFQLAKAVRAKGGKTAGLVDQLVELSPKAAAAVGLVSKAKAAVAKKIGFDKEATVPLTNIPIKEYRPQVINAMAQLFKDKKPKKASDFVVKDSLLSTKTRGQVAAEFTAAAFYGLMAGVPEAGAFIALLKQFHGGGLNNKTYNAMSTFMATNFINYFRQLTPEQEQIARQLASDVVAGRSSIDSAAAKISEAVTPEVISRATTAQRATPVSRKDAAASVRQAEITPEARKTRFEEALDETVAPPPEPVVGETINFVDAEGNPGTPSAVRAVVKDKAGISVYVEGMEQPIPITRVRPRDADAPAPEAAPPKQATQTEVRQAMREREASRTWLDRDKPEFLKEPQRDQLIDDIRNQKTEDYLFHTTDEASSFDIVNAGKLDAGGVSATPFTEAGYGNYVVVFRRKDLGNVGDGGNVQLAKGYTPAAPIAVIKMSELGISERPIGARARELGIQKEPPVDQTETVKRLAEERQKVLDQIEGMNVPELKAFAMYRGMSLKAVRESLPEKKNLKAAVIAFVKGEEGTVRSLDATAIAAVDKLLATVPGSLAKLTLIVRRLKTERDPAVRDVLTDRLDSLSRDALTKENIPTKDVLAAIDEGGEAAPVQAGAITIRGPKADEAYVRTVTDQIRQQIDAPDTALSLYDGLTSQGRKRLAELGIDSETDFANLSALDKRSLVLNDLVKQQLRLERNSVIDQLRELGIISKRSKSRTNPTLKTEVSETGAIKPDGFIARKLAERGLARTQDIPIDPAIVTAPTKKIPTRYYDSPSARKLTESERMSEKYGGDFAKEGTSKPAPVSTSAATPREVIGQGKVREPAARIEKVISGGQVGADKLGLEVARELGIKTGGTAPKGFRTRDGADFTLRTRFNLKESKTPGYRQRTEQNVIDSDGTVVFAVDTNSPGTRMTRNFASKHNKPYIENPTPKQFSKFVADNNIRTINVAGNRVFNDRAKVKDVLSAGLQGPVPRQTVVPKETFIPGRKKLPGPKRPKPKRAEPTPARKPIVAKVRREGEVVKSFPERVKEHTSSVREQQKRDVALSRYAADDIALDGIVGDIKDFAKGFSKDKQPAAESATYAQLISNNPNVYANHNVFDAAVKQYGPENVPFEVSKAYARSLAETYGPDSAPAKEFGVSQFLTKDELAAITKEAKSLGLEFADPKEPVVYLSDVQAANIADRAIANTSMLGPLQGPELPPSAYKRAARVAKSAVDKAVPPKSSANLIPETPLGIEKQKAAINKSKNLTEEQKQEATNTLVDQETEMHQGGAAVPAGTRPDNTNPTYDFASVLLPELKPSKDGQGFSTFLRRPTDIYISEVLGQMKDILKGLGIVRERGTGPKVYGAVRAIQDAAGFGWSILASEKLQNAIAKDIATKALEASGLNPKTNRTVYYKFVKEVLNHLDQYRLPLLAPIGMQGGLVARIPGTLKLSNGRKVDMARAVRDTLRKEMNNPDADGLTVAQQIARDAIKNLASVISAEAGRAGFYKGMFNYHLRYFFDEHLDAVKDRQPIYRQNVQRPGKTTGYNEVIWSRVEQRFNNLTLEDAAKKIVERRVIDDRSIPNSLPGNLDGAQLASYILDPSNRKKLAGHLDSVLKEKYGTQLTLADTTKIFGDNGLLAREVPQLKTLNGIGENLELGFFPGVSGGRTKGSAASLSPVVQEMFVNSQDPIFKTSADIRQKALPAVWKFKVTPGMNNSFGWSNQRFVSRSLLERMVLNSKGKMTVWNLPTQQGNYFSNVGTMSMYFGNMPMDTVIQTVTSVIRLAKYRKLKRGGASSKAYRSGQIKIDDQTKRAYDQLENLQLEGSDLAQAELAQLSELPDMADAFSSVGSPRLAAVGSYINEYFGGKYWAKPSKRAVDAIERGARTGYNFGDAGGKLALYEHHFKVMDGHMNNKDVTSIQLEQSLNSKIVLNRDKNGRWYLEEGKPLSQKQIDRYMAIAAERNAYRLIPNYLADVGAIIPVLRANTLGSLFSWFPTWSYKMVPLPGKRGILSAIFFDDNTYTPMSGNSISPAHVGTQALRALRAIAYMNSLKGVASDIDVYNGQVNETGPGTFTLGNNVVYDSNDAGYSWVSSARNMNSLAPALQTLMIGLKSAGGLTDAAYKAMGIEPTEEVKRLNKAFESGFLKVGMKEALDISLITGNVISEMLMMGQGAKQYGFKEPGLTEYLVKASAAFIGGTPAQLGYGLLAAGGPTSPTFKYSPLKFSSPFSDGDYTNAVPIGKMVIQRVFGGFKKVNMTKKEMKFVDKFTKTMQDRLDSLKSEAKMIYRTSDPGKALSIQNQINELSSEIERQKKILQYRRIKPGRYVNVGRYAD